MGLFSELHEFEVDVGTCRSADDIKTTLTKAAASKKIIENLVASVRGAIVDTFSARTNMRRAAKERAAAAEKRRQEGEAAATGPKDTPTRKRRVATSKVGVYSIEEKRPELRCLSEADLKAILSSHGSR